MTGAMIVPLLGGLVLYVFISALVKSPGRSLQRKFVASNPLKGKPMAEIIAKCGEPSSRSSLASGNQLYQWQSSGYHIALLMDAQGTCQGVTHQYAAK
jgi:hypothetical protein